MRIRKSFNNNWKFHKLPENVDEKERICIDLPHTWNDKDGCDGKMVKTNMRRDISFLREFTGLDFEKMFMSTQSSEEKV